MTAPDKRAEEDEAIWEERRWKSAAGEGAEEEEADGSRSSATRTEPAASEPMRYCEAKPPNALTKSATTAEEKAAVSVGKAVARRRTAVMI